MKPAVVAYVRMLDLSRISDHTIISNMGIVPDQDIVSNDRIFTNITRTTYNRILEYFSIIFNNYISIYTGIFGNFCCLRYLLSLYTIQKIFDNSECVPWIFYRMPETVIMDNFDFVTIINHFT